MHTHIVQFQHMGKSMDTELGRYRQPRRHFGRGPEPRTRRACHEQGDTRRSPFVCGGEGLGISDFRGGRCF